MKHLVLSFVFLSLAACNSNPTGEEVIDRAAPGICTKIQECNAAGFAATYPGGIDDCAARTKSEMSQKYGSDLDRHSVCSDDEVDSCMKNLEAETCPADGSLPAVPCDC